MREGERCAEEFGEAAGVQGADDDRDPVCEGAPDYVHRLGILPRVIQDECAR